MKLSKILVSILAITLFLPGIVSVFFGNECNTEASRNLFYDNLVAYWGMDELYWNGTTGEVIDSSGNGHNGTAYNGANTTFESINNKAGMFLNDNDYIDVPSYQDFEFTHNDNFTICFWRKDFDDEPSHYMVCSHDPNSPEYSGWSIHNGDYKGTDGQQTNYGAGIGFFMAKTSTTGLKLGATIDNNWHFITITKNGTNVKLYVDAIEKDNDNITESRNNEDHFYIGALWNDGSFSTSHYFNGVMDEIRIYNRSLSVSEILSHFKEFAPVHNIDTDKYFTTIQKAIDDAGTQDGHTIFVKNGTYYENVIVNKTINIIGENKNNTIIDGSGTGNTVIITAHNINISKFTIRNGDFMGVHILSDNNYFKDCIIRNNSEYGMLFDWSDNNTIYGNNITFNVDDGIKLKSSNNNTIIGNIIKNNWYGIRLETSCKDNIISSNSIMLNDNGGIRLRYSNSNNSITGNNISVNDNGIILNDDNGNNYISGNIISHNDAYGLSLTEFSEDNIIFDNNIHSNNGDGIYFRLSNNNTVKGNTIALNGDIGAFLFSNSNSNHIFYNNFINNQQQAYDEYNNTWDNGYPSGGNYYSDFDEPIEGAWDNNSDGIVDSPYDIPGGSNQDLYPLIYPWHAIHPDTVYVDDGYNTSTPGWGYDRFNRIQYGINEVNENGTVFVYNGTYYENININKNGIKLIGENKYSTIIDANGTGDVVLIEWIYDDISISHLTIRNGGANGIYLNEYAGGKILRTNISNCIIHNNSNNGIRIYGDSVRYTTIFNCEIFDNQQEGILMDGYRNNIILNSSIYNNSGDGIRIANGINHQIISCTSYGNDGDGISVNNSVNCTISSNTITNNDYGIHLYSSNNNTLTSNTINNNTWFGIYLYSSSSNNTLINNTATNNSDTGICMFSFCNNNILVSNTANGNLYFGINLFASCNNNILINNTVINSPQDGIQLSQSSNNTLVRNIATSNNEVGIYLSSSNNNTLISNTATNNSDGIILLMSSNNVLTANNASNNCVDRDITNRGITLGYSKNNFLTGNTANNNTRYGIYLYSSSSNNTLISNTVYDNTIQGLHLSSSSNNKIYHNNIDNAENAYDDGNNSWDNGYPSGGNYWSNYTGIDTNGDGIGETPYNISGGANQDRYPFVNPLLFMELPQGWNLITVPFNNTWTAETLGENISGCTTVCWFNASSQTYVTHVMGIPYNDFPIEDGVGYFIYVSYDSIFTLRDVSISSVNVSIDKNWNIVGWCCDYPTTAASLGENITGTTVVCMFNAETQTFKTHVVGIPYNNFVIERGMGLFIYTTEASIWHGEG